MPEALTYSSIRVAKELADTAMGFAYYGNALRVAKDFPCMTPDDRSVLDRWATGLNSAEDGHELQRIAMKLDKHQCQS